MKDETPNQGPMLPDDQSGFVGLGEVSGDKMRQLYAFCAGRPRARRLLRSMIPPCEMQIGAHRMMLYPHDNWTDFSLWLKRISPEDQSLSALEERIAGKKSIIFDIGANCGSFTLRLAEAAGPGSVIHAFEPNPVMLARLQKNLSLNTLPSDVIVHDCALGDETGTATLSLVAGNYGQATLRSRPPSAKRSTVEVKVEPLSSFFDGAENFERRMIKIDVEGFEDHVLHDLFDKIPAEQKPHDILIETDHRKNWKYDLIEIFKSNGYKNVLECEQNVLFTLA